MEVPRRVAPPKERTFLGHPRGLYVLFLTQMWERFSFFGMLALLILYLNQYFKLSQDSASSVFKWYTSIIYFTPLVGGFLADRYLGNKRAVIIGAVFVAVGHFLMTIPTLPVLYAALACISVGLGLFTPPLTTQVGLLYHPNDPRRDSAYTIFYMGINLGAFLSPLLCGWLKDNTRGGFHSGLALPGIGMAIGLATYALGQRWVVEVDQKSASRVDHDVAPEATGTQDSASLATSEGEVEQTPSVFPLVNRVAPKLLAALGVALAVTAPVLAWADVVSVDNALALGIAAVCAFIFAWVTASVGQGLRDRVLAILVLFVFAVVYWAGASQYGNTFNLWAEQNTNRYLSRNPDPPGIFPEAADAGDTTDEETEMSYWQRWVNMFKLRPPKESDTATSWIDPVPTPWFQSINPLMILVLAPLFAMLWTWLDRFKLNPSIPVKMALGLLLMTLAFALMIGAAWREGQATTVALEGSPLPGPLTVNDRGQICKVEEGKPPTPYAAGRLFYDQAGNRIRAVGVFPDQTRDDVIRDTAPADFVAKVEELQKKSAEAAKGPSGWSAQVRLDREPGDFDLRYAGLGEKTGNKAIRYDPATRTLTTTIELEDKEIKGLKVAAGDPHLRASLNALMLQADANRISPWWLVGFFLLATMGELCLTPVGLSMVSQLAPARFATMLMGLWLLTWTFANYIAGAFGEKWGTWAPVDYFIIVLVPMAGATAVLFALARKIGSLMHEAKR
jgi:proton-dependent oligopeptide transporter, POT family